MPCGGEEIMLKFLKRLFRRRAAEGSRRQGEERVRRLLQEEAARKAAEAGARESRRIQDEERRQREQLHVTLSSIGDGVIVTDGTGAVTFMNPVAEALTGWRPEEAVGQP